MKFYISTLGEFDIKVDGQSILRDSNRMYRIYKLFEYFLTFRNKKLLPETIIDNLLSDSESEDPKNMLRTQIFRLRKIINALIPKGELPEKYMNLNFTNGYYCLEIGENTIVDIDVFENLIQKGTRNENMTLKVQLRVIKMQSAFIRDCTYPITHMKYGWCLQEITIKDYF